MIDRKLFFDAVRARFGALSQPQVDGFEAILAEWERRRLTDLRWLAYILATTWWETDRKMQPIREYGRGKGRAYGQADPQTGWVYYGRGYVQLTWKANYASLGKRIGVDLVNRPDLALDPRHAARIMFEGMIDGLFTGRRLSTYFDGAKADWVNARRIINGTDKAATIAAKARAFYAAVTAAWRPAAPPLRPSGGSSGGAGASGSWDGPAPPVPSPVAGPTTAPAPPVASTPSRPPAPAVEPPRGFWARFLAALRRPT